MKIFAPLAIFGLVVVHEAFAELGSCSASGDLDKECLGAEPKVTTPQGCECASECGATIDDLFKTDWCYTKGSCGSKRLLLGLFGHWDYCQYKAESQSDFSLDWQRKHEALWERIIADETIGEYDVKGLFFQATKTTWENEWDVMPVGRTKSIHGIGAVCQFSVSFSKNHLCF